VGQLPVRVVRHGLQHGIFGVVRPEQAGLADGYFRESATLTHKMLGGLPSNRDLINHIKRHGLQKI
jgi:hypothetical protein